MTEYQCKMSSAIIIPKPFICTLYLFIYTHKINCSLVKFSPRRLLCCSRWRCNNYNPFYNAVFSYLFDILSTKNFQNVKRIAQGLTVHVRQQIENVHICLACTTYILKLLLYRGYYFRESISSMLLVLN